MTRELAELAIGIASEAAQFVRAERGPGRYDVAATKSSVTDPVTDLDRRAEQLIRARISGHFPDDSIVGEEHEAVAGTSCQTWIIDPIDGTVNFVYGLAGSAVAVAVGRGHDPDVAVIVDLGDGQVWWALRGGGAWKRRDGHDEPLTGPPEPAGVGELLVATGFNYVVETRARQGAAVAALMPHIRDIRRRGSASMDFVALAEGTLDAYVEEGLKLWDWAPGTLLATEAGLRVGGLGALPNERLVVAAHPAVYEEFSSLVIASGF